MNEPIYEIPVTPEPVDGWHPGRPGRAVPDAFAPDTHAPDAFAPEAVVPDVFAPQTWPQPAATAPQPAAPAPQPAAPAPQYAAPATQPADAAPQYAAPSAAQVASERSEYAPDGRVANERSEYAYRDPSPTPPPAFETLVPRHSTGEADALNETGAYPRDLLAGAMPPTGAPIPAAAPAPAQVPIPAAAPAPAQPFDAAASAAPTLAAPTGAPTLSAPIELEEHARLYADRDLIEALVQVVQQKASDLHLTEAAPPMLRVNGALRSAVEGAAPWDREKVSSALHSLLSPDQAARFEEELELDFAYGLAAQARFRVNIYQQRGALGAAFRLIPTEIKQLKDLGVPDTVGRFAGLPRGLVLVTGPTGSGKSTTLAALIDLVNSTRADHIVTVEDPIEFIHKHKLSIVNQREVGADTHSFANALKHVLRQDPDVILIGELRDLETISVALTAAETGHLVFATLHTQDAPQSIDRVIDVFPPHQQDQVRTQLAGTLQGVISQTLVPKASGEGRVVATEILTMTPAIANLIREGKTYQISSAMQAGRDLGMHTMDQHLAHLVDEGRITHKAALAKAQDVESFARLVQRAESPTAASARALAGAGPDFGDAYSGTVR